jgi:DNA (cytosine-5)-methyltransferase 1
MSKPRKRPVIASTAISLFSGAGGDSLGLKQAGYTVSAFSEFKKHAINTHLAEFPLSRLLTCPETGSTDIIKIPDETFEQYSGNVDVIFSGFPCFPADTLVLTSGGYKEIQNVAISDTLLSHKGVFQPIKNLQQKTYSGRLYELKLKYNSEIITATEEHPFYVRTMSSRQSITQSITQSIIKKKIHTFGKPQWKKACDLSLNDFCGMAINKQSIVPEVLNDVDQWFTMGYFIGTSRYGGWIHNDNTVCFNFNGLSDGCAIDRINRVLPLMRNFGGLIYKCVDARWCSILSGFINTSDVSLRPGKLIPEWVQNAPIEFVQSFIDGFLATFTNRGDDYVITTMSYNIAYGLQRLYLKLGKLIYIDKIKGGDILQYNVYLLQIADDSSNNNNNNKGSSFIEGDYVWWEPFSITTRSAKEGGETVYNFEVKTDNSYTVCNTLVHNCQGFSNAGKKRADDPRNELVHEFVRVVQITRPRYIIGENVHGLLSRQGYDPSSKRLRPVIDIIRDLFSAIGYNITYKVLKATDFGVPQERRRLIIVGTKSRSDGLYPHMPWDSLSRPAASTVGSIRGFLETHLDGAIPFKEDNIPDGLSRHYWIITKETKATGKPHPNLIRLNNGIHNKSSKEREGGLFTEGNDSIIVEGGLISFGVRRSAYHGQILDPDMPCKTIICTYGSCPRLFVGLYNPDDGSYWVRCLSVKELGQIQGFPADYKWQGNEKEIIMQIGNAVPPPLCESVIRSLPNIVYRDSIQGESSDSKNKEDNSDNE